MRAVVCNGAGGSDVLQITPRDVPQPQSGEVLIKVAAAGIHRPDILQRQGYYAPPAGTTDILGLEVSGTITALGADVTQWTVGDDVCALLAGGGYAEYAIADAELCLPIPNGWSVQEAASLPEVAFTCYANIIELGRLKSGETILIHGGSSGIGSFGIQLAKAWGVTVITTVGSNDKAEFCKSLGANFVINYKQYDFAERVMQFTNNRGVDVVLDMVGGDYVQRNLSCLAPNGRHVSIAVQGGRKATIDVFQMMQKQAVLTGSVLRGRSLQEKRRLSREVRKFVWPLIEQGKIKSVIDKNFALADVRAAHDYMESGGHMGKIILI